MKKTIAIFSLTLLFGYEGLKAQTEPTVPTTDPKGFVPKKKKNASMGLASKMSPDERASVMTQTLKKKLSLTESQIEQVKPINLVLAQSLDDLIPYREDKTYFTQKYEDAQQTAEKQLFAILTPEQIEIFKVMKENNQTRRGGM